MNWTVEFSNKAAKQVAKLPLHVADALAVLILDISSGGPVRGDWPNYSKLSQGQHHCHLKKGRPVYVAVWREVSDRIRVVEVTYAGTHEKARY
jgi:mRNA-degrading endonuclease RelE of RelBE toxin-antitoxin system